MESTDCRGSPPPPLCVLLSSCYLPPVPPPPLPWPTPCPSPYPCPVPPLPCPTPCPVPPLPCPTPCPVPPLPSLTPCPPLPPAPASPQYVPSLSLQSSVHVEIYVYDRDDTFPATINGDEFVDQFILNFNRSPNSPTGVRRFNGRYHR